MTDEQRRFVMSKIEEALRDPTCVVSFSRGIKRINDGGPWLKFEPTDGQTITIEVKGGAQEEYEDRILNEALARILKEEK